MRILVYLARHPGDWIRGADLIASATGVPRAYAVKVLHLLGRTGLVRTKVGCHGGYRLARDPDETSALDIVTAVDGSESLERCLLGHGRCSDKQSCVLHPYWSKERARIEQSLNGMTLSLLASIEDRSTGRDHRSGFHEQFEVSWNGSGRRGGKS